MVSARTPYIAQPEEVHLNPTTDAARTEHLVTTMTERMTTLTRTLSRWMQEQEHSLADVEHHVVRLLKELGASLVAGLCSLAAAAQPSPSVSCSCGHQALYQRQRKAQVTTLLGPISIWRSYYLCAACGHGQHPLDAQLQFCAGSRSAALDELLALLGATQDSFVEAAQVLERLTLVHVSANSVRDATEQLGGLLLEHQAQPLTQPEPCPPPRPSATARATRLYITMDGVLAHLHERGWSEIKVGCCYHTRSRVDRKRPERLEIRAHSTSYVTALEEAQSFGWRLWQEALRRGVLSSDEVVVLGDGAHWIWNIAERHFPQAIQIVDWYHASEYVWQAASAIWGEANPERSSWAHCQLDALWEGKVAQVLLELEQWRASGEAVEAVAAVRAWLKSERWEEAIALRSPRRRSYRRKQPDWQSERSECQGQVAKQQAKVPDKPLAKGWRQELTEEVLAQVQAELAEQRSKNAWVKAWSVQRQRELAAQREEQRPRMLA